ncbi:hypothetical protein [Marinobacter salexigens]|uniref:hypothetical protein n=1 Tax=Marinobacter salexigens TaxID=1925763 RepID=UPI000C282F9C|nr:hypothetical protein [Marinobacter salexigens]
MNAKKMQAAKARKYAGKVAIWSAVPATFLAAGSANAADWAAMTAGLDFSGEETAIIAIVGVLFGFYVVRRGANLLLSMIR